MKEDEKPQEQNEMEKNAEELERRITRFTNIDKESFTHSFRGISTTIGANRSQIMRLPEADHLATHLARKILSRDKKSKNLAGDKSMSLWSEKEILDLKSKILSEVGEEGSGNKSAEDVHKRDSENLEKEFGGGRNTGKPIGTKTTGNKEVKMPERKEIIAELEKRGQTVDVNKTNEELLQDLMESEAQGK